MRTQQSTPSTVSSSTSPAIDSGVSSLKASSRKLEIVRSPVIAEASSAGALMNLSPDSWTSAGAPWAFQKAASPCM